MEAKKTAPSTQLAVLHGGIPDKADMLRDKPDKMPNIRPYGKVLRWSYSKGYVVAGESIPGMAPWLCSAKLGRSDILDLTIKEGNGLDLLVDMKRLIFPPWSIPCTNRHHHATGHGLRRKWLRDQA
jgi:hypothetical protein